MNRTYNWDRDYDANVREGRIPDLSILMPVRRTMAVLGAVSVVLLFVAGRLVGGTLVGAVAGLAATWSPLLQLYFVQARTEALLALFSAAGLVALLFAARHYQRRGSIPFTGWLVGPILGITLATKLTAALAIVGACAYAGSAGLARIRSAPREALRLVVWSVGTGLLATGVWIVVNPFLWPDPVGRTWSMLEQQQSIMVEQGQRFGNPVSLDLPGRLLLMAQRTYVENSTPPFDAGLPLDSDSLVRRTFSETPTLFGISVELTLAAVGLAVLIWRVAVVRWTRQRHGPESALLWWLSAYFLGIAVNLSLDWPRYYVPTAFYGALLIGLGAQRVILSLAAWLPWSAEQRTLTAEPRAEAAGHVSG